MKFVVEIDLSHESIARMPAPWRAVAKHLQVVASRLESDSHHAISDGVVRADNFIPSECGTFRIIQ